MKLVRGFTLIELLIVISVISVLATIGISSFAGAQSQARDGERKSDLKNIQTALRLYYNDQGAYPASTAGFEINACGAGCNSTCAWDTTWSCGTTTYMQSLPGDPASNIDYRYTKIDDDTFTLQACLEGKNDQQGIPPADTDWCDDEKLMFEIRP